MEDVHFPELARLLQPRIGQRGNQRTQAEVARRCGVSQAAVFYWKDGQKRPELKHIHILALSLSLPVADLVRAAGYRWPDYQAYLDRESTRDRYIDLDDLREQAQAAYLVRVEGNPQRSIAINNHVQEKVRDAERYARGAGKDSLVKELRILLADTAHDVVCAYQELLPKNQLYVASQPLIEEIERVAHDVDDISIQGLTLSLEGNYRYITRNLPGAITTLKQAREATRSLNKRLWNQLMILRALVICYASLGEERRFSIIQGEIEDIVQI